MSPWGTVAPPGDVEGGAPDVGRLEPALQWLARCQGGWPPRRPASPARIDVDGASAGSLDGGSTRADTAVDAGADLLVVSGSGDQASGLLVAAVLLDIEPVKAIGTAGVRDWARLTVAVRDGLRAARPHRADPVSLLDAVGAAAVAELAGVLAQAASRRTPVLLDGSALVGAATLVAGRLAPGASAWWLAGQAPPAPAARGAHTEMGLAPLLDLRLGLPAGADLALGVLCAAVDLVGAAGA
jgi:nicotinate-nucleotide--dimethylbenzimidazole phosphoribosyltransferase